MHGSPHRFDRLNDPPPLPQGLYLSPELLGALSLDPTVPTFSSEDRAPSERKRAGEAWLQKHFVTAVPALGFAALAATIDGKQIIHPERFRFAPITSSYPDSESSYITGYDSHVPEGIRHTYLHNNYKANQGRPFMDTQFGIGLIYNDWLVALGAAQVELGGPLRITQLQDVTGTNSQTTANKRLRFRSGLYNNFAWRDTLVAAWDSLAAQAGAPQLQILGAKNSRHYAKHGPDLLRGYDAVAERMAFSHLPDGNWVRPVATND